MVRHIVWWELKPEVNGISAAENAKKFKVLGEALAGKIQGLQHIEISHEIKDTTTLTANIVLQSTHDSFEDLAVYAMHPEHLKFGEFVKKVTSSRSAIDYEI